MSNSKPYRVMCLETCEIQGVKFYEGVTYTATFPLEGQSYYFPDGNYPDYIEGVAICGVDAMKFEPFMNNVEFEPKKPITVKLGNIEVNQVQPIGFPVHKPRDEPLTVTYRMNLDHNPAGTRMNMLPEFALFDPQHISPRHSEANPPRDTMLEAYALGKLSDLTGRSLKDLARQYERVMWNE